MTVCVDLEAAIQEGRHTRQLADISSFVRKSKRIVVVTGAGISCSSGIPDFRSSDGLYALAKEQYPTGVAKGSDLFDAALFRNAASTAAFFTFISCLKKTVDAAAPTPTHLFLSRLHEKGRLLRLYTQNIDGLEERAGLAAANPTNGGSARKDASAVTVQLHGDIHRLRCVLCSTDVAFTAEHIELYSAGQAPPCPNCTQRSEARTARSGRATRIGILRPGIVLYNEPHPLGESIASIEAGDLRRKPDMLIIMGTTLRVHGLKLLVKNFAKSIHAQAGNANRRVVYVNRTPPAKEWAGIIDYHVLGDTDAWVHMVQQDWVRSKPSEWVVQTLLDGSDATRPLRVVKDTRQERLKPDISNVSDKENIVPTFSPKTLQKWGAQSHSKRQLDEALSYSQHGDGARKREKLTILAAGVRVNIHAELTASSRNEGLRDSATTSLTEQTALSDSQTV